jgi:hypothetical protein
MHVRGADQEQYTDESRHEGSLIGSFFDELAGGKVMKNVRRGLSALGAMFVAAGAMSAERSASEQIDHVVLAISDVARGSAQLGAACGVKPVAGGKHPNRGTQNALLSAGSRVYLEVLAPQEGAELSAEYKELRTVADLRPIDWAVSTRDAAATVRKLKAAGYGVSELQEGSRMTPEGKLLRWKTFGVTQPELQLAPFFIEWDAATPHPSTTSPEGCTLQSVELRTPHDAELRRLLGLLNLSAQVTRAETPMLVITLQGKSGLARLPAK